jgi:hypothetical protein
LNEWLRHVDEMKELTNNPGGVPRNWIAVDLPLLKNLTRRPQLMKMIE